MTMQVRLRRIAVMARSISLILALSAAMVDPAPALEADAPPGGMAAVARAGTEIYAGTCAVCHDQGVSRAPQRFAMSLMSPGSIYRALTAGVMKPMAAALSDQDKLTVAQYLASRSLGGGEVRSPLMCARDAAAFDYGQPPTFTGWGLTPDNAHAITTAMAGINRSNIGRLKLKWALAFPEAVRARSQPAVAGGAIFVGSHNGTVYALDPATGCARWLFKARAEVRTGIVVSPWKHGDRRARPLLYFGDIVGTVYAVDAVSGTELWSHKVDPHPAATLSATPALYGGLLFVPVSSIEEGSAGSPNYPCCTFRGSVVAFDAATGVQRWQTFMTDPPAERGVNAAGTKRFGPSGAAIWGTPAIDPKRRQIYIATGDNYSSPTTALSDSVMALDLRTGRIRWATQATARDGWNGSCGGRTTATRSNCPDEDGPDFDFGAAPVLAKDGGNREYVVAGQKSGVVWAFNPDNGQVRWKTKVGRGGVGGGVQFGIAVEGDKVFVPIHDRPDGATYSEPARPGMYALSLRDGGFLWKAPSEDACAGRSTCYPGYAGAITATPDLVLGGSIDGHLRVFDSASGAVLWDFDTAREFTTVNGDVAQGGSMAGGAAPLAYRGLLLLNSGYQVFGIEQKAGNVFLVFGVD
jgi:polyvinyl alcohol dehydrogenase (cytochrome)